MSRKPNLRKIEGKLMAGQDFSLTRQQYIDSTGADLPQRASYTAKKSAVARKAQEYGFEIIVVPEVIKFVKKTS